MKNKSSLSIVKIVFFIFSFGIYSCHADSKVSGPSAFSSTTIHKVCPKISRNKVSRNKVLRSKNISDEYVWVEEKTNPFSELIVSWNARRPIRGQFDFYVSIGNPKLFIGGWSPWRKLAEWGVNGQKTLSSAKDRLVHVKHVRVEMQRGARGRGYKVKVVARNGAELKDVKTFFANQSYSQNFKTISVSKDLPSFVLHNVPRQSQMKVKHKRCGDFCSPTSTSMIVRYFNNKFNKDIKQSPLDEQVKTFARKAHDDNYLDIYGNWILNSAQAYNDSFGKVAYRVERLNSFDELYRYLKKGIPVAVSIRGWLRGGYKNYKDGHFVVVVGWSQKRRAVICIDPVFRSWGKMLRAYKENDFLKAWGKSRNLSYIAAPLVF